MDEPAALQEFLEDTQMEFEKIIELIQAVSDSNLTQFQIQDGDWKVSMKTDKETKQTTVAVPSGMYAPGAYQAQGAAYPMQGAYPAQGAAYPMPGAYPAQGTAYPVQGLADMAVPASASMGKDGPMGEEENEELKGNVVKSPLVGTYYQASSPENGPFVQVGDVVKKGQVLGIVEAMKLMNEIESEFDGTVKAILVENEQLVEYGQPMFVIG